MVRKIIVSDSFFRAIVKEKQENRPYTAEQGRLDAQVQQRVQEFVRTQRQGADVLRHYLGKPVVF